MTSTASKYLATHLNDHLAIATGTIELARRVVSQYGASDLGALAQGLMPALEEDRRAITAVMARTGARRDPVKTRIAWAAEKAGRLKLNGRLTGRSPLSPLVELTGLSLGLSASVLLWQGLAVVSDELGLDADALRDAARRAERARDEVEGRRPEIARSALIGAL